MPPRRTPGLALSLSALGILAMPAPLRAQVSDAPVRRASLGDAAAASRAPGRLTTGGEVVARTDAAFGRGRAVEIPGRPTGITHTLAAIDLGVASVEYDDYARASVASFSPSFGLRHGPLAFSLRGALSRFETGHMSAQGGATANYLSPAVGPFRAELGGDAGVLWYRESNPAVNDWLGSGRLHLGGDHEGAWLGGGTGRVVNEIGGYAVQRAEAGLWARAGPAIFTGKAERTMSDEARYTDVVMETRWRHRRMELSGSLGARSGDTGAGAKRWLETGATVWITRSTALSLGAGRYPPDATQGAPGGRFAALTMRLASERISASAREAVARTWRPPPAQPPPVPVAERFAVRELRDRRVRLQVEAPLASRVEVMGDFTDWEPLMLTRHRDGTWTTELTLTPGVHRLNVRVDRGVWGVPPGMSHATDDFGGVAGLFVVR